MIGYLQRRMKLGKIYKRWCSGNSFSIFRFKSIQKRPALVIAVLEGEDLILCQITSKYKSDNYAISLNESDFIEGNLKIDSYIRPNKIFTAHKDLILYKIGHIKEEKLHEVLEKLEEILKG